MCLVMVLRWVVALLYLLSILYDSSDMVMSRTDGISFWLLLYSGFSYSLVTVVPVVGVV